MVETAANPKRVLIVSNNDSCTTDLTRLIQTVDPTVEVRRAQNGLEAIRDVHHCSFDLVVMDFLLPELDGLTTSRVLKSMPDWKRTPIILTSDIDDDEVSRSGLDIGVHACVMKPFTDECFVGALQGVWKEEEGHVPNSVPAELMVRRTIAATHSGIQEQCEGGVRFRDFHALRETSDPRVWDWVGSAHASDKVHPFLWVGMPAELAEYGERLLDFLRVELDDCLPASDTEPQVVRETWFPIEDRSVNYYILDFETMGNLFQVCIGTA